MARAGCERLSLGKTVGLGYAEFSRKEGEGFATAKKKWEAD